MEQKITNKEITVMAIACITLLELVALLKGIDGILLMTIIAVIAGMAGWQMPPPRELLKVMGKRVK